ncbi:hypothetical protein ACM66B_007102 [Microbotryomycetes sp. NB124-2]
MSADQAVVDAVASSDNAVAAASQSVDQPSDAAQTTSTTQEEPPVDAGTAQDDDQQPQDAPQTSDAQQQAAATNGSAKDDNLTLRALVNSKEAGIIIGRGGSTIANVRTEANVKAGVSKVVPGIADRILSIGGPVTNVSKAYSIVAQTILENPVANAGGVNVGQDATATSSTSSPTATTTVRLLISHLLIGSVIGKGGSKIRQIQETSGARMVASKEMLPQSTERIVEVTGTPEGIRLAVSEIAKCLLEDWERSQGTVLYHPGAEGHNNGGVGAGGYVGSGVVGIGGGLGNGLPGMQGGVLGGMQGAGGQAFGGRRIGSGGGGVYGAQRRVPSGGVGDFGSSASSPQSRRTSGNVGGGADSQDPNYREQKISIPADMVGCIIGRGGSKINEIRRLSGSRITIAKTPHDETGERLFVISGLPDQNEKALYLLYNQLELEKNRRVQQSAHDDVSTSDATTNAGASTQA